MLRRLKSWPAVLALLLAAPAAARAQGTATANFAIRYDLDSTTLIYPRVLGQSSPFTGSIDGRVAIKTAGSNTTVDADTASTNPFTNVFTDDVLVVDRGLSAQPDIRTVVARASADSVTIDTAVDWTGGRQFRWYDTQAGSAEGDGWINVSGWLNRQITFYLEQISGVTGGINTRLECRSAGVNAKPVIAWPGAAATAAACGAGTLVGGFCNFTVAGVTSGTAILLNPEERWAQCRFGLKIGTSDAAETVEGDKERITITFDASGRTQ